MWKKSVSERPGVRERAQSVPRASLEHPWSAKRAPREPKREPRAQKGGVKSRKRLTRVEKYDLGGDWSEIAKIEKTKKH